MDPGLDQGSPGGRQALLEELGPEFGVMEATRTRTSQ